MAIPNGRRWLSLGFALRVGGPPSRQVAFLKAVIRPLPRCDYDTARGESGIKLSDGTEASVPTGVLSSQQRPEQEVAAARVKIQELQTEMRAAQLRRSNRGVVREPRINGGPMKNGHYTRPRTR